MTHRHVSLVAQFVSLKNRDWEVSINHIFREANFVADYLANIGHDLDLGTHVFLYPDSTLLYWLRYDLFGVSTPRLINNNP
ncbi:Putative ribonuclease H protein At1g65750 [Linum perenne]